MKCPRLAVQFLVFCNPSSSPIPTAFTARYRTDSHTAKLGFLVGVERAALHLDAFARGRYRIDQAVTVLWPRRSALWFEPVQVGAPRFSKTKRRHRTFRCGDNFADVANRVAPGCAGAKEFERARNGGRLPSRVARLEASAQGGFEALLAKADRAAQVRLPCSMVVVTWCCPRRQESDVHVERAIRSACASRPPDRLPAQ